MKRFRIVFYGKYRRPISTHDLYAFVKTDAVEYAKKRMTENVRGYMIQTQKLDVDFCLSEIVKNNYYMRIGKCFIYVNDDGTAEVCDWDNNRSEYDDLLSAIDAFISCVNSIGR